MELTKEIVLKHTVDAMLDDDAEFMPDYSGRGMYGETTPAITSDDSQGEVNLQIMYAVADLIDEPMTPTQFLNYAKRFRLKRKDNRGLGYVYY